MNKRIRELAEQAGIDFFNSTDPEYFGRVYCEGWTEQQQKFAELIVRECAQLARDTNLEDVEGGDSEVLRAAKNQILEHFGVEE